MKNNSGLPDFIVIGAMKCGTTSLWEYLKQHPNVQLPHGIKNIEYFDSNANWNKGLPFYKKHFNKNSNTHSIGEISTEYTKYPHVKDVAKNMYATLPCVKLVYLIRLPMERLISHYIHNVGAAKESRDINSALQDKANNPYILYSLYFFQLEQFLKHFNKDDILIITTDNLLHNREQTLNSIFKHINIEIIDKPISNIKTHTRQSKKSWNRIGKIVRRSPKYFNYYNYYLSKLPKSYTSRVERLLCRPIKEPVINDSNFQHLSKLFSDDLASLQKQMDIQLPRWNLTTGSDKNNA